MIIELDQVAAERADRSIGHRGVGIGEDKDAGRPTET